MSPTGSLPERGWVRSHPVRTRFRPDEYEDLVAIAEGWSVPVATAMWAIVVDQLARFRKRAPELGPHGLAIAAALVVLRQPANFPRTGSVAREPLETR